MIPLSRRYLTPLVALLLLAWIPVAIRQAGGNRDDSCANPAGLYEVSDIPRSEFERQHPHAAIIVPSALQWSQGYVDVAGADGHVLKFDLVRANSALELYAWSRKALSADYYMEPAQQVMLEAGSDTLPVLIQRNSGTGFAAMLFVDTDRPTARPIATSLRRSAASPAGPVEPSTLFFVRTPPSSPLPEEEALRWIRDAWRFYRATCGS